MSGTAIEIGGTMEIPIVAAETPPGGAPMAEPCRTAAEHALERAQQAAATTDLSAMRASLEAAIDVIDAALDAPGEAPPEHLCAVADDLETALDSLEAGGSPDLQPVIEKAQAAIQN